MENRGVSLFVCEVPAGETVVYSVRQPMIERTICLLVSAFIIGMPAFVIMDMLRRHVYGSGNFILLFLAVLVCTPILCHSERQAIVCESGLVRYFNGVFLYKDYRLKSVSKCKKKVSKAKLDNSMRTAVSYDFYHANGKKLFNFEEKAVNLDKLRRDCGCMKSIYAKKKNVKSGHGRK